MLEIRNLRVNYSGAIALDGISLNVGKNEVVAVLGSNGAGKSTLLRAISGVLSFEGQIQFGRTVIGGLQPHRIVESGICHCPEGRRLFPDLSAKRNLELGAYLNKDRRQVARDLDRVFDLFPVLLERADQRSGTLSGGEQQMLAIGRALMGRPRLLLLDEPSVGIASKLKKKIFSAIQGIRDAGTAILLVEQDAMMALKVADRAYVLESGRLAREGSSSELINDDHVRRCYLGI
jgi:branched-chain amino acid transport system ATP-binding protein